MLARGPFSGRCSPQIAPRRDLWRRVSRGTAFEGKPGDARADLRLPGALRVGRCRRADHLVRAERTGNRRALARVRRSVGARVSMALYLPNGAVPEVAIGRVSRTHGGFARRCRVLGRLHGRGSAGAHAHLAPARRPRPARRPAARLSPRVPVKLAGALPHRARVRPRARHQPEPRRHLHPHRRSAAGGRPRWRWSCTCRTGGRPSTSRGIVVHRRLPGRGQHARRRRAVRRRERRLPRRASTATWRR